MKNKYRQMSYEDAVINCLFDSCNDETIKSHRNYALNNINKANLLSTAINKLTAEQQYIINGWFNDKRSLAEIAYELNINNEEAYSRLVIAVDALFKTNIFYGLLNVNLPLEMVVSGVSDEILMPIDLCPLKAKLIDNNGVEYIVSVKPENIIYIEASTYNFSFTFTFDEMIPGDTDLVSFDILGANDIVIYYVGFKCGLTELERTYSIDRISDSESIRMYYFNSEVDCFDCKKAYSHFVGRIGTTMVSRMTDEEYKIFKTLCFLKKNYNYLKLNDVIEKKNKYLMKNFKMSFEDANEINILDL